MFTEMANRIFWKIFDFAIEVLIRMIWEPNLEEFLNKKLYGSKIKMGFVG